MSRNMAGIRVLPMEALAVPERAGDRDKPNVWMSIPDYTLTR